MEGNPQYSKIEFEQGHPRDRLNVPVIAGQSDFVRGLRLFELRFDALTLHRRRCFLWFGANVRIEV